MIYLGHPYSSYQEDHKREVESCGRFYDSLADVEFEDLEVYLKSLDLPLDQENELRVILIEENKN